jgi:phosphopantothenoylcysteine synthetase/decarboxylase
MSEILLGVSGSAACFKAAALASGLAQRGHSVTAVLSRAACKLVTPLQFACLTGNKALHDEWQPEDPAGMDHIQLARKADLFLLAPATADRIGILANGLAPDLLGSVALAVEQSKPRVFVPAMNPDMWQHPAVQRNVAQLDADGWLQVGPTSGRTACEETGLGRMAEIAIVLAEIDELTGK